MLKPSLSPLLIKKTLKLLALSTAVIAVTGFLILPAVLGIIYGAVLSFAQTDLKRLVAYSSISHMGFVLLGIYLMRAHGVPYSGPAIVAPRRPSASGLRENVRLATARKATGQARRPETSGRSAAKRVHADTLCRRRFAFRVGPCDTAGTACDSTASCWS